MNQSNAALLDELRHLIGASHVLTEPMDVAPFVEDWRGRYRGEVVAVVQPASTQEVADVVQACAQAGVKVVPQGGHTSMVGGATPVGARLDQGTAPVVVTMRRMNRIREIDAVGNTLIAEAGCILQTLQEAADQHGRLYGVTFGAQGSCQIGGNERGGHRRPEIRQHSRAGAGPGGGAARRPHLERSAYLAQRQHGVPPQASVHWW